MSDVAVVVCTRNRPALLRRALASLAEQTLARDRYQIVVADNGDGSGAAVAKDAEADLILRVAEPGVSRTRNAGWRAATAPRLAFLDDDAEADPAWLELGLQILDRSGAISTGGPILPLYDAPPPAWFRDEYELRTWGDEERLLVPGESFSGSNLFLIRDVLDAIGGFDDRLGMRADEIAVGEEPLFFEHLWRRSDPRVVYSPRLIVRHRVGLVKMTVGYQLRRAAAAGEAWAIQRSSGRRDFGRATRDASAVPVLTGRALLRLRRPWQRWAVEELGPVAGRIGSFRGALR
jgi:glycosyltransferase involved in cell wall biosynthesis